MSKEDLFYEIMHSILVLLLVLQTSALDRNYIHHLQTHIQTTVNPCLGLTSVMLPSYRAQGATVIRVTVVNPSHRYSPQIVYRESEKDYLFPFFMLSIKKHFYTFIKF